MLKPEYRMAGGLNKWFLPRNKLLESDPFAHRGPPVGRFGEKVHASPIAHANVKMTAIPATSSRLAAMLLTAKKVATPVKTPMMILRAIIFFIPE